MYAPLTIVVTVTVVSIVEVEVVVLAAMIEKVSTLRAMEKEVLKLTRGHCLCGLSIVGSCGGLDAFNLYNAIYMLRIDWWRESWPAIRSSGAAARALVGTLLLLFG